MRVYLPATFAMLRALEDTEEVQPRNGWGFAVTSALRDFYVRGEEEELENVAFLAAAEASVRLLGWEPDPEFPYRRVVISVDLPDNQVTPAPENGDPVVKISAPAVPLEDVAAIHVDVRESEETTRRAIGAITKAELGDEDALLIMGDAEDNLLAWYDPSELPFLLELL